MDISKRLALSYYKTIAVLNEDHHVSLVQHQSTKKIYVKKILDIYHLPVYEYLSSHPITGIPRIIDFAEEQGQLTVIEEYISGFSLQEKIEERSLTVASVTRYLRELCDILEQLHSVDPPIVHRDIKPTNIMITHTDHVVLLDFNAAKYYSEKSAADTMLLGTQGYAAPEQYGFGSSSPRTDIYGLGIVLQELCTVLPDIPKSISQIADKCTQMDPKDRFASVTEVRNALPGTDDSSKSAPASSTRSVGAASLSRRKILPPGFRSKTPWKMITASISYSIILWLAFSLVTKDPAGNVLSIGPQWFERIFFLLMELSVVCITCDYLHVQRLFHLQHIRQPVLRWLCVIVVDVGIVFFLMLCMLELESVIFPG